MDAEGAVGRVHRVTTTFLFSCVKLNLRVSSPERRRVAPAAVESHRRRQVALMRVKGDVRDVLADGWTSRTSRYNKSASKPPERLPDEATRRGRGCAVSVRSIAPRSHAGRGS